MGTGDRGERKLRRELPARVEVPRRPADETIKLDLGEEVAVDTSRDIA
nr:hypothetical protein [Halostella litorea]